eukprot:2119846-Pyramimonas_sp.AAC.1
MWLSGCADCTCHSHSPGAHNVPVQTLGPEGSSSQRSQALVQGWESPCAPPDSTGLRLASRGLTAH